MYNKQTLTKMTVRPLEDRTRRRRAPGYVVKPGSVPPIEECARSELKGCYKPHLKDNPSHEYTKNEKRKRRFNLRKCRKAVVLDKMRKLKPNDGSGNAYDKLPPVKPADKIKGGHSVVLTEAFKTEMQKTIASLSSSDASVRSITIASVQEYIGSGINAVAIDYLHEIGTLGTVYKLMCNDPRVLVKVNCSWIIANLSCSNDKSYVNSYLRYGIPEYTIKLLNYIIFRLDPRNKHTVHEMDTICNGIEGSEIVPQNLIWCMGNLIIDNVVTRDNVVATGVIYTIFKYIRTSPHVHTIRVIAAVMYNLLKYKKDIIAKDGKRDDKIHYYILKCIKFLFQQNDKQTKIIICNCFERMMTIHSDRGMFTSLPLEQQELIACQPVAVGLIKMLDSKDIDYQRYAMRALSCCTGAEDDSFSNLVNLGILEKTIPVLTHNNPEARGNACVTISNLCCVTILISRVCALNIIPTLINMATRDVYVVKVEAQAVLMNILSAGSTQDTSHILKLGVCKVISTLFKEEDCSSIEMALTACKAVLGKGEILAVQNSTKENMFLRYMEIGGVIKSIEEIQDSKHGEVRKMAIDIISRYLQVDEEEYIGVGDLDNFEDTVEQLPYDLNFQNFEPTTLFGKESDVFNSGQCRSILDENYNNNNNNNGWKGKGYDDDDDDDDDMGGFVM